MAISVQSEHADDGCICEIRNSVSIFHQKGVYSSINRLLLRYLLGHQPFTHCQHC